MKVVYFMTGGEDLMGENFITKKINKLIFTYAK